MSDDIAYNNHDIQDGLTANLFSLEELKDISFFEHIYKTNVKKIKQNKKEILIYQIIRDSINLMVKDLIKNTIQNIKKNKIKNINDVYKNSSEIVKFSNTFEKIDSEIRIFLREKMYQNKKVLNKNEKGKKIIQNLFKIISKKPKKFIKISNLNEKGKYRAVADFISGMTDRYAINLYKRNI